jgi:putative heme-binding domain-containing protein
MPTTRVSLAIALVAALSLVGVRAQAPVPTAAPSPADLASGAKVYEVYCARCHGLDGSGGSGPPLARAKLRRAADEAGVIAIVSGGIPGTPMPAMWSLSELEVQQVAAHVLALGRRPPEALPGDPARGRVVYDRTACATCHLIDGEGATIGPELSEVGLVRGAAFLRESLLEPGRAHPTRAMDYEPYEAMAYVPVRLQPRAGGEITGLRVNEDPFTIQVREATGRLHSFRKADLQTLVVEKDTSIMPSYRGQLDEAQIADLVSYLMSRRGRQ